MILLLSLSLSLVVLALIHAEIPNIHMILTFLHSYGETTGSGEISYYMTCLEAAVEYIMQLEIPPPAVSLYNLYETSFAKEEKILLKAQGFRGRPGSTGFSQGVMGESMGDADRPSRGGMESGLDLKGDLESTSLDDDEGEQFQRLGEWLRDMQQMEDTLGILQAEGWMV